MLKVNVKDAGSIDKALKTLKNKVKKTKQNEILRERKEFVKDSVKRRTEMSRAKHRQSIQTKTER